MSLLSNLSLRALIQSLKTVELIALRVNELALLSELFSDLFEFELVLVKIVPYLFLDLLSFILFQFDHGFFRVDLVIDSI